jgi:hypothetical protein
MCMGKSLRELGLRRRAEKWGWAVEKLVELKTIFEIAFGKGRPAGFGKARSRPSNP